MRCKTVIYGGWQPKQTLDLVMSIVENKIIVCKWDRIMDR